MQLSHRQKELICASLLAIVLIFSILIAPKENVFDKTAIPYIEEILPAMTSWKYKRLKPLLSPTAAKAFETEEGKQVFRLLKKLRRLGSTGKPEFQQSHSELSEDLGDIEILLYEIHARFETGQALIKLHLAKDGEQYYIHQIGVNSDVFTEI